MTTRSRTDEEWARLRRRLHNQKKELRALNKTVCRLNAAYIQHSTRARAAEASYHKIYTEYGKIYEAYKLLQAKHSPDA